jgi:hypothetical protein
MRVVLTLLAVLTILLGAVWVLQGFNMFPGKSFMNGQHKWALYGACLAFGGFVLLGWARGDWRRRER